MVHFLHQQTIGLFFSKEQMLTIFDKELCQQEAAKISENQLEDGSFPIPWQWGRIYKVLYQRELVEIRSDHQEFFIFACFFKII